LKVVKAPDSFTLLEPLALPVLGRQILFEVEKRESRVDAVSVKGKPFRFASIPFSPVPHPSKGKNHRQPGAVRKFFQPGKFPGTKKIAPKFKDSHMGSIFFQDPQVLFKCRFG
jgi:hypothetical protein